MANPPPPPPSKGPPTDRYSSAVAYIDRAFKATEASWWNVLEWKAAEEKQRPFKQELTKIQARWTQVKDKDDKTREPVARDAELLADHVKESLPGAPSDWKRTNLFKGEVEHQAAATSFLGEVLGTNPSTTEDKGKHWRRIGVGVAIALGAVYLGGKFVNSMGGRRSRYDY